MIFEYKKHGFTYHLVCRCCGKNHYINKIKLAWKFLFSDSFYYICPVCGRLHHIRIVYHLVHDENDYEKEVNKNLRKKYVFRYKRNWD